MCSWERAVGYAFERVFYLISRTRSNLQRIKIALLEGCVLVGCFLLCSGQAGAQQSTEMDDDFGGRVSEQTVRAMLGGFETTITIANWQEVGAAALPILLAVYRNDSEPGFVRLRAMAAVAAFPSPETFRFLNTEATLPGQDEVFIRTALLTLSRAFGEEATNSLAAHLLHRAPAVREAACRALLELPQARAIVSAHLMKEANSGIRHSIERMLRRAPVP